MASIVCMEYALKADKNAGNFLNATEFLVVLLQCIPGRIEFNSGRLKPLFASKSSHAIHALLWVSMSTLANYVFAFHISVPIHTLFRSCNVISSVTIGFLVFNEKYSLKQMLCVCVITVGIFLGSIGDASVITGSWNSNTTSTSTACIDCGAVPASKPGLLRSDLAVWSAGVAMLVCCQIIQAFLGHKQHEFYRRFSDKAEKSVLSDEYCFTSHLASMLMILVLWEDISSSAINAWSTPPLSAYFPLPRGFVWVILNNITQLCCIKGVFRLSALYTPLTVNITLSVRKFMSVVVSILWFGNAWTILHSIALVGIFGGVFAYTQCPKPEEVKDKKL